VARDTRGRIIDGARASFFSLGYEGTRLERLAQKLGITKKTIYNHFPSKEHLLLAVLDKDLAEWISETRQIVREPGIEMGERFMRLQGRAMTALQRRSGLFPTPPMRPQQKLRVRLHSDFVGELAGLFAEVVDLARQSGYVLPDVDPLLMSHMLINLGAGINSYCAMASVPYDATSLMNASLTAMLRGVLTELGLARLSELPLAGGTSTGGSTAGGSDSDE
jgi:AcrR family transcriptional regulator